MRRRRLRLEAVIGSLVRMGAMAQEAPRPSSGDWLQVRKPENRLEPFRPAISAASRAGVTAGCADVPRPSRRAAPPAWTLAREDSLRPAAAAAICLALAGCSTEPIPAPEGWAAAPARIERVFRGEGPLLAGAARVSLDPPYAVPMGGYFGGSEFLLREERDPLRARALVLEAQGLRAGKRVLCEPTRSDTTGHRGRAPEHIDDRLI